MIFLTWNANVEQIERKGVFILHNPRFFFFSLPKENTAFNSCTIRSETLNLVLTSPFRNLAFFRQEDQAAERHICLLLRLCKSCNTDYGKRAWGIGCCFRMSPEKFDEEADRNVDPVQATAGICWSFVLYRFNPSAGWNLSTLSSSTQNVEIWGILLLFLIPLLKPSTLFSSFFFPILTKLTCC